MLVDARAIVVRLLPLFFKVSERVAVLPACTLPNKRLDGLAEIRLEYDCDDDVTPKPFKPKVPASPQLKKTVPVV